MEVCGGRQNKAAPSKTKLDDKIQSIHLAKIHPSRSQSIGKGHVSCCCASQNKKMHLIHLRLAQVVASQWAAIEAQQELFADSMDALEALRLKPMGHKEKLNGQEWATSSARETRPCTKQ